MQTEKEKKRKKYAYKKPKIQDYLKENLRKQIKQRTSWHNQKT